MRRGVKAVVVAVAAAVVFAVAVTAPARAATTYAPWAAAAHSLPLHWALSDSVNVNDPVQVGERSLTGAVLPPPAVLDIDGQMNTAATVATLHGRGQRVICYFDAGVYESYRPDAYKFPASVIGAKDGSWAGSYWLDIRQQSTLLPIMGARMDDCVSKGFDMIEPDEIDGWENTSGFPLTYADQVSYNRAVANLAHSKGIAILQKGDIIQTRDLVDYFDATLNEECYRYKECTNPWNPDTGQTQVGLQAYTAQDKAVWVAEYTTNATTTMCGKAPAVHFNGARYKLGLPNTGGRAPCAGTW